MSLLSEGSQPTDALLRAASRLARLAWLGLAWAGLEPKHFCLSADPAWLGWLLNNQSFLLVFDIQTDIDIIYWRP